MPDPTLRAELAEKLGEHVYSDAWGDCSCGERFAGERQWAEHVAAQLAPKIEAYGRACIQATAHEYDTGGSLENGPGVMLGLLAAALCALQEDG